MGFFSKLLGGKDESGKIPKGYFTLSIAKKEQLTSDAVAITFAVPSNISQTFDHIAGQYITVAINIDGEMQRRAYSICSAEGEGLTIGVKRVAKGKVSNYLVDIEEGSNIYVLPPAGSFKLEKSHTNIVAFAAGSGITPILSIATTLNARNGSTHLFYGNKNDNTTMFGRELSNLEGVDTMMLYSQGEEEAKRIDGAYVEFVLSKDEIGSADAYFLCGPEAMILNVKDKLIAHGISSDKIHFELFTTPVLQAEKTVSSKSGTIKVTLDGETFNLKGDGSKTVLELLERQGVDAPYSCKGAVCCTCKAKVMSGTAEMKLNFSLTDEEIAKGFILTCQAVATSENLAISYDE
jgi:ring-1,2-phenylacetyl-CoA epoxidase subunit PaaE